MEPHLLKKNKDFFNFTIDFLKEGEPYIWPGTGLKYIKRGNTLRGNSEAIDAIKEITPPDFHSRLSVADSHDEFVLEGFFSKESADAIRQITSPGFLHRPDSNERTERTVPDSSSRVRTNRPIQYELWDKELKLWAEDLGLEIKTGIFEWMEESLDTMKVEGYPTDENFAEMAIGLATMAELISREHGMSNVVSSGWVLGTTRVFKMMYAFASCETGKHVFRISPGLTQALKMTEFAYIDSEHIRFPFESFMLEVPNNTFIMGKNNMFNIEEIYCSEIEEDGYRKIELYFVDRDRVTYEAAREIAMAANAGSKTSKAYSDKDGGSVVAILELKIKDGDDIVRSIEEQIVESMKKTMEYTKSEKKLIETDYDVMREMTGFVINTVLYLQSSNKETRYVRPDNPGIFKNRTAYTKIPVTELGSNIMINKQLIGEASFCILGKRVVTKTFVVRGHMANVRYGPKKSLSRLQWIAPYFKGPEREMFMQGKKKAETNYNVMS